MTPDQAATAARELLAAERSTTTARLDSLRADFASIVAASEGSNADDEHDPEGSTIAFERSQVVALVAQAEAQLTEVVSAQERLAAGTYGTCERCGRPVARARLEARPTARSCVACA